MLTERDRQAEELSLEILELARNTLIVELRFLDRAIGNMKFFPDMNFTYAGCARYITFSPWTLIRSYQEEQTRVTRDLLHSILHNVFRHSLVGEGIDKDFWDLAADIAVENIINDLDKGFLSAKRSSGQSEIMARIAADVEVLSAERIYSWLEDNVPLHRCLEWRERFMADDHQLWYGMTPDSGQVTADVDLNELWKDIAKRMQTELEVFHNDNGALTQSLRELNRARYNYTEFLRRFGRHSEVMKLSEEEFDNNYYTYGLELYGNIPLIEPLEYRDQRSIRDFVIAIDTSGSVQGEVVQKFVQHTHDILVRQDSFASRTNIYIIQCDDEIRETAHITCREEFDRYITGMEIRGLGRTDFRPVFEYVDGLIADRKLTEMRGLLYFTDGKGVFPAKKPDYDVAFIIHNDSLQEVWVPEWAVRLEMPTDEIMNL